ncbi:hypothetical protein [Actinoplanes awajinensis]|uniref:Uncharacterized protein n=1 Tax=Actinoplanes awajinensis subsp. mycoplanecinus TaxID=135947 RepID=A0A0X3V891_9ACTN|nr:hypothetical protein [Actinoplanes awajinensis]KUL40627.1 hypothetical protein ADL15_06470 [Actinoplanes awajinensis subsp. mycoplanecinus]
MEDGPESPAWLFAQKRARIRAHVAEQLPPGETFQAAVWAARIKDRTTPGQWIRRELNPKAIAEDAWADVFVAGESDAQKRRRFQDRRGVVDGAPGSLAAQLDGSFPIDGAGRILILTDRRLMVLTEGPESFLPPAGEWLPPLSSWRDVPASLKKMANDFGHAFHPNNRPITSLPQLWQGPRPVWAGLSADQPPQLGVMFADGSGVAFGAAASEAGAFIAALEP